MKALLCTDCGGEWFTTATHLVHFCNGLRREKPAETEDERRAVTECASWFEANAELIGLRGSSLLAGQGRRDRPLFEPGWVRNQSYSALVHHPALRGKNLLMTVQLDELRGWTIHVDGDGPPKCLGPWPLLGEAFQQANGLARLWCLSGAGVAQA